jgi:subtilisin-like proprotein convertase family protein
MKTVSKFICTAGLVGMAATASAQVFRWDADLARPGASQNVFPFTANASIPDGDMNGVVLLGPVNIAPGTRTVDINSFSVYIDIVGDPIGGNGDLDVYLKAPNGTVAQLINRPGFTAANGTGYQDNGMRVVFYDGVDPNANYTDIHYYQQDPVYGGIPGNSGLTGVFKTDGRDIDPLSSTGAAFDAASRTKTLAGFQGIDPAGQWELFAADVAAGGNSMIKEWGIDLTPIPEPESYAIAIGAGLIAFALYRRRTLKTA